MPMKKMSFFIRLYVENFFSDSGVFLLSNNNVYNSNSTSILVGKPQIRTVKH